MAHSNIIRYIYDFTYHDLIMLGLTDNMVQINVAQAVYITHYRR